MQPAHPFGFLALAIEESVHRACQAHLLETPTQGEASAVQSDVHIAQCGPQARRRPLARLAQQIDAPDHISIGRRESRQDLVQAGAHRLGRLGINNPTQAFELELGREMLPLASTPALAQVIHQRGHEDPAQPGVQRARVTEVLGAFESANGEALEHVFRILFTDPSGQESDDDPTPLN
jgi:hypothetical protein